jgi:5-methyltetrahydropteroyltriglutamate--homocysteine methyltransferase
VAESCGQVVEFLRANTDRKIKVTVPGRFTMSRQAKNEFYKDEERLVMDYAAGLTPSCAI